MTLLLSRADVQHALAVKDAIDLVERGFVEFGQGGVDMPQRPVIFIPEQKGMAGFMPALIRGMGALSVKTVTAFKDNPKKALPTIFGLVTLLDPETGVPLSIMDAAYLTAARTGAATLGCQKASRGGVRSQLCGRDRCAASYLGDVARREQSG